MSSFRISSVDMAAAPWKAALELYYDDKVVGALDIASPEAGAYGGAALRDYSRIEGEALTRASSHRAHIMPWLELEWIPEQVPHHEAVGQVILHAALVTSRRLQWDLHESVLVTILAVEADSRGVGGYCVDKTPYDKICLPRSACGDPNRLLATAAHEFAHVVVLNTALKVAPQWLDEGIACLMEGRDAGAASARLTENGGWRSVLQMGGAFDVDRRDPATRAGVHSAYDQATVLVAYLHSLAGDEGLVKLLKALVSRQDLRFVLMRIAGRDPVDMALRKVYGFGQDELFARVKTGTSI